MSRFPSTRLAVCAAVGLGIGIAHAQTSTAPASPSGNDWARIVPQKDLQVWQAEGTGNGALAKYKPAHPPGYYNIGSMPTEAQIAGWDIAVPPNGANLPPGKGTVADGEKIFSITCAMCHGSFGEGKNGYPQLVGGVGSLASNSPEKTPGSYWPYATTIFDYINRAMPFYAPHTLKPDQVYSVVAWLLNANGIVKSDWIADAKTLPLVKMPNRDHWDWKDPRPVTHNVACMTNCANPQDIKITSNAAKMNLTPRLTGPLDRMTHGK